MGKFLRLLITQNIDLRTQLCRGREKPREDTSEDTSGRKPTEVFDKTAEAIENERSGPIREVDLVPAENEK